MYIDRMKKKIERFVDGVRSFGNWGFLCVDTTVLGTSAILISFFDEDGFRTDHVGRLWSRINLESIGIEVDVEGRDNLDPESPYVIMVNHSSLLDIFVIYDALPRQIRWVMKSELRKVPIFGFACEKMGHVYVKRGSGESAKESMRNAARKVSTGASVVFFPEGTRNNGVELLPFKKGGFRLAIQAEVPIVPVVIHGTVDLMPPGDWVCKKGRVKVNILKPIPTQGMTFDDLPALMAETREVMDGELKGNCTDE